MTPLRDIAYARLCDKTYQTPGLGDEFAFISGEVDGLLTVCFRGTQSWKEWLLDLFAFPLFPLETSYSSTLGPLHAGFLIGAQKLRPAVAKAVDGKPYALCGHSLGGALAAILAGYLTASRHPPKEIVTFGSPRAGTTTLSTLLRDVPVRAYQIDTDLVPLVPTNPPFAHIRALRQLGAPIARPANGHDIRNYIRQLEERNAAEVTARSTPAQVAG